MQANDNNYWSPATTIINVEPQKLSIIEVNYWKFLGRTTTIIEVKPHQFIRSNHNNELLSHVNDNNYWSQSTTIIATEPQWLLKSYHTTIIIDVKPQQLHTSNWHITDREDTLYNLFFVPQWPHLTTHLYLYKFVQKSGCEGYCHWRKPGYYFVPIPIQIGNEYNVVTSSQGKQTPPLSDSPQKTFSPEPRAAGNGTSSYTATHRTPLLVNADGHQFLQVNIFRFT